MLGHGGTHLPGKLALSICPHLLHYLAREITCLVVTGTNGKTTSSRMVEQGFKAMNLVYIANRSGANLLPGITAEFVAKSSLRGKLPATHAVIECDEGATAEVCRNLHPVAVLVTNIFNDQLDRYGSTLNILDLIRAGIRNSPGATLCLNADDALVASLSDEASGEVLFYSVEMAFQQGRMPKTTQPPQCLRCGTAYDYTYLTYDHLGDFHCPGCGYHRPDPQVKVTRVVREQNGSLITLVSPDSSEEYYINLPGNYNIYNAVGAATAMMSLGFGKSVISEALGTFKSGFGRMERFTIDNHEIQMILVKNPTGFNQVIDYLGSQSDQGLLAICLNSYSADGTDFSWIGDVHFDLLSQTTYSILISGERNEEILQCLRNAGLSDARLRVITKPADLLTYIMAQDQSVIILPSYTAMLEIRGIMAKRYSLREYWE